MTVPASKPEQDLSRFDEAAATWDENPHRRAMAEAIARGIREMVPLLAQAGLRIIHEEPAGAGGLLKVALVQKGSG